MKILYSIRFAVLVACMLHAHYGFAQDLRVLSDQIQKAMRSGKLTTADSLIDLSIRTAVEKHYQQPVLKAYFLSQKGNVLHQLRRSSEAVSFVEEAISIYENYPQDSGRIATLITAGNIYLDTEQLVKASKLLHEAEEILAKMPSEKYDENLKAGLNNSLGGLSQKLNNPDQAYKYLKQAVAYYKRIGNPNYVTSGSNLIVILGRLGKIDELIKESSSIKNYIDQYYQGVHPALWRITLAEAQAKSEQGDSLGAVRSFESVLELTKNQYGSVSMPVSIAHSVLASFYQRFPNTYSLAVRNRVSAIDIAKKLGLSKDILVARSLNDLASLYMKMELYKDVVPVMTEAQEIMKVIHQENFGSITDQEKEQYVKDGALIFNNTLSFTSRILHHLADSSAQKISYNAALYLNGLLLDDSRQIRNVIRKSGDTTLTRLYKEWLYLKQKIVNLPPSQRPSIASKIETLERQLNQQSTTYKELRTNNRATWKQVQSKLQPKEASVAFVRLDAYIANTTQDKDSALYAAMVIRPEYTYPHFVLLGAESQLRQLLEESETPANLYSIRGSRFGTITYGDSLYRFVWQPIEQQLQNVQRIYFSVDGLLHRIAFAALPLPGTTRSTPPDKKYLSDRFDLQQLFSTRQIVQGIRPFQWQPGTSALLMGGIMYEPAASSYIMPPTDQSEGDTLSEQSYLQDVIRKSRLSAFDTLETAATKAEVEEIHAMLPQSKLVMSKEATEALIKQQSGKSPAILHLATHGFYIPYEAIGKQGSQSDEALMRSGLALAGANRLWKGSNRIKTDNDGLLTAYEVSDLDLSKTRLVTLSACQSALGDLRGPEGVFGLQRAFRLAGAEKLLVSLWPVGDEPTHQLMRLFYTNLKAGKEVRTAFKQAQQNIRRQFDEPAVWAAFVLVE